MIFFIIIAVTSVVSFNYILQYFVPQTQNQIQKKNQFHILRRIQHLVSGLIIVVLILTLEYNTQVIATFCGVLFVLCLHVIRKCSKKCNEMYLEQMKFLLRPHEVQQIPGAFYFLFGIWLSLKFFGSKIALISTLILSVGDPAASLIGIKIGGKQIMKGKTYSGTIGCGIVCAIVIGILFHLIPWYDVVLKQIGQESLFLVIFLITIISEVIPASRKYHLDDNLTIPVLSSILLYAYFNLYHNINI